MKVKANQVFVGEITDLTLEEMKLIAMALEIVRDEDLEESEMDISNEDQKLAKELVRQLNDKLRESNWRE